MKLGLLASVSEITATPAAIARKAEAVGFESIWFPEHTIIPVQYCTLHPEGEMPEGYAHFTDPFVSGAFAAAATSRIKIGTAVCLVPEHNPIELAKKVSTLDFHSGGRFLFGAGAGWLVEESEVMGVDFKRRWPITREYIAAMKELWTKPESIFQGRFTRFPAVKLYPKPVQKPYPPIHIGAGGVAGNNDRAVRETVAMGDGWMPAALTPARLSEELAKLRKLCAEAGRVFSELEISTVMLFGLTIEPARALKEYAEVGAHRIIVTAPTLAPDKYERELEAAARDYSL